MDNKNVKSVFAPINGKVISLDEVPDPVFLTEFLEKAVPLYLKTEKFTVL